MDYEKKYKEALKRARQFSEKPYLENSKGIVDYIFPELKESENTDIITEIKNIITYFYGSTNLFVHHHTKEELLAWLEKQSEQGNNEDEAILHRFSFYSYKDEPNILYLAGLYVNDEYRNKGIGTKILKIADEVAVSMKCSSILLKTEIGSNAERLYKNNGYSVFRREENQVWLEKQGEQKPADKVESKFKVGDWVVYNRNDHDCSREIIQVYHIRDGRYYFNDNIHFSWSTKECDEKSHLWTIQDAKDGDVLVTGNKNIFIFKSISGYTIYDYCGLYFEKFSNSSGTVNGTAAKHLPTDYAPATKEQRDLLFKKMKEAGYEWDAEKKELKKISQRIVSAEAKEAVLNEKQEEQVSEEFINALGTMLNDGLPDRYLVSEERIKDSAELLFSIARKQLKNEMQEWSEEDEINLFECIKAIKGDYSTAYAQELSEWLKSLKPQNTWKPSDEQMDTLEYYMHTLICNEHKEVLFGLYADLKKLREE